jgi:hypothetical protein
VNENEIHELSGRNNFNFINFGCYISLDTFVLGGVNKLLIKAISVIDCNLRCDDLSGERNMNPNYQSQ